MNLVWQVNADDVASVRAFVEQYRNDPMVRYRVEHNIAFPPTAVELETFWTVAVGCLLTTQQRSGPGTPVARLQGAKPFPLSYAFCAAQTDVAAAVQTVLQEFGGIRRHGRIAQELAKNYQALQQGLWPRTEAVLRTLLRERTPAGERAAADFIRTHYAGFGPKQSRNLLQGLGLTQYEIPIDSRVVKWLETFGFPYAIPKSALSDAQYFNALSDAIQGLCRESRILPCVLDAAIFTSFDNGGWTDETVVW